MDGAWLLAPHVLVAISVEAVDHGPDGHHGHRQLARYSGIGVDGPAEVRERAVPEGYDQHRLLLLDGRPAHAQGHLLLHPGLHLIHRPHTYLF